MKPSKTVSLLSVTKAMKLIQELKVHQIELEMQNEELRVARSTALDAAEKYTELYDLAPSGYFTLSSEGKIIEINLAGSQMLGKELSQLKNSRFGFFVSNGTIPVFNHFLRKVFVSKTKESCEVTLSANGNLPKYVYLTGIVTKNEKHCIVNVIDITDRERAEEIIKDNEKRFRELIESLPQLFWTCRCDGTCDYLSKQWVEYTGIPETEQLGYRWLDQIHPEDRDATFSEWLEKVITGNSFDFEFRMRRNDGEYHWFKTTAAPMRDNSGNIEKWFGSNTDIHEIKIAEEQLRNFNKELEQQVDERTKELQRNKKMLDETGRIARVGGWEIDLKKNELSWTDMVYQIHEIGPEYKPIVEKGINFFAPEAIPVISEAIQHAIADGQSFDMELPLITAKKNKMWVRAVGEAYRENGEIVRIGGMLQDITERRQAEEALRISEKQYRTLFNTIDEGLCIIEVIFDENKKPIDYLFLDINPSFGKQTGLTNALGKRMRELVPKHEKYWFEIYGKIAVTGQPSRFENRAEQLHRWYDVYAFRVDQPENRHVAILFNDITERKQAENELKTANELLKQLYINQDEVKEKERKAISREIHDELGQLLSALKIDLGWTKDNLDKKAEVGKKIKDMNNIVNDTINTVQKIAFDLRPGLLDDLGLVPAMEWYCQEFEKRTGIKCHFKSDDVISTNENKNIAIYRILQESLTNVVRHANAKNIHVNINQTDDFIILEIIDDGTGIKQEVIDSNKSLGLIGIRERVKHYNGSLDITSAMNKGTKISVNIPID